jgi:hypothetical protein
MGQTIRLEQRKCPSCAAALPPVDPAATEIVCAYCRQRFGVVRPAPKQPRAAPTKRSERREGGAKAPPAAKGERPRSSGPLLVVVALGLGVALFGTGGLSVVGAWLVDAGVPLPPGMVPAPPEPDPWVPAPGTEGHLWIDQYASPALADVDGDGRLDLLAITATSIEGERRPWIGAYRGQDFAPLWQLGPLPSAEARMIGLVVVGDRLVVQEPFGVVSVVELATGRRIARHTLAENQPRAQLCRLVPTDSRVLLPDRVVIDAADGSMRTDGPRWHRRPAACQEGRAHENTTDDARYDATQVGTAQGAHRVLRRPEVPGHRLRDVLIAGDDGVAVLEVSRGPAGRVLMGFEPGTYAERWRQPVTALGPEEPPSLRLLDVGEGAVIVGYELGNAQRMALLALDAMTGEVRWRMETRGGASLATFGDGSVWLPVGPHASTSAVLRIDLQSGEYVVLGGR